MLLHFIDSILKSNPTIFLCFVEKRMQVLMDGSILILTKKTSST